MGRFDCARNYLRVRGEYIGWHPPRYPLGELPPRARRIHTPIGVTRTLSGTTSACAENTLYHRHSSCHHWNYLRVRGEYSVILSVIRATLELPPRARRIRGFWVAWGGVGGTTSACAENTRKAERSSAKHWNYLRVRGEYCQWRTLPVHFLELPPRARRIPRTPDFTAVIAGTTSACAENTGGTRRFIRTSRNYLRVRGEYRLREGL